MRDANSDYDAGCYAAERSAREVFSAYSEGDTIPYETLEAMDDMARSELTRLYGQVDLVLDDDGEGYLVRRSAD